ncbi:helicase associated domain-containing protein [Streptomyces lasalocidi]|uniref:helicase associated domain-containing protein n=1 Tax=Streptomyces lasalocidi TaxID=324833 RepID=UPI003BAD3E1B
MLDRLVGQWLSNLRWPGALEGHPEWKAALESVDADWNPAWPAEWQRHYAALRELVAEEEGQAGAVRVLPGFTVHGMDIGKWLARQRRPEVWQALTDGPCQRSSSSVPQREQGRADWSSSSRTNWSRASSSSGTLSRLPSRLPMRQKEPSGRTT